MWHGARAVRFCCNLSCRMTVHRQIDRYDFPGVDSQVCFISENHHKECFWLTPDRLYDRYTETEGLRTDELQGERNYCLVTAVFCL